MWGTSASESSVNHRSAKNRDAEEREPGLGDASMVPLGGSVETLDCSCGANTNNSCRAVSAPPGVDILGVSNV